MPSSAQSVLDASTQPVSASAQPVSTSSRPLHFAQTVFAAPLDISHHGVVPLSTVSAFQYNTAQLAPLTARDSLHSAQTTQMGSVAQFNEAVSAPHTYDDDDHVTVLHRVSILHREAAAPPTAGHVSPRTASSNEVTPTYLSDAEDPP